MLLSSRSVSFGTSTSTFRCCNCLATIDQVNGPTRGLCTRITREFIDRGNWSIASLKYTTGSAGEKIALASQKSEKSLLRVSRSGDWGSVVSDVMDRQAPAGLLGIHVNMPATVPEDVAKALKLIRIPLTSFGPSAYFVAPRREAA